MEPNDGHGLRRSFQHRLDDLGQQILRMGQEVETSVQIALQALVEQRVDLADQVMELEQKVNETHMELEDRITQLVATEQPVATDLRLLLTSLAVVGNLERMADLAVHIARVASKLADEEFIKPLIDIPRMGDLARGMIHDSLAAFDARDTAQAQDISARDDIVDNIYSQIFRELLTYMMEDQRNINQATSLLFVAKQLERIGDMTTTICESVLFVTTGKRIDLNQ